MLLTDITKIIRVLLAAFETVASQDDLTQRRIGQIGQVINELRRRQLQAFASQRGAPM